MGATNNKRSSGTPRLVTTTRDAATKDVATRSSPSSRIPWRRIALYATLAGVFFLLGLIPTWLKLRATERERETAQRELRLTQMENKLAAAVISARRGDYEPARQMASDFFTSLRHQIDRGSMSDLSENQRSSFRTLLSQRDQIITLLARNDPAATDLLSNTYATYRKGINDIPTTNNSS